MDLNLQGFIYSNGSEIANRGWEFSGEYKPGRFSINATFSIINSFIKDTTGAYQIPSMRGKAPGTKMINLPAHTAGVNLNYLFKKLFGKSDKGHISLNMTGLEGVLYQDYRRYTLDVAYGRRAYTLGASGDEVENTVFRLGLYADYSITRFLTFFIQGANILNDYEYEFSSEYPMHGETWLFGFKYNYSKSNKSL